MRSSSSIPTIAEREAELAALQSAFDEYITSSRELEEELDAELAKMQEKLAQSSAANAALSSQLENMAPQLSSLEKALTETRARLEHEGKLRRHAEQSHDDLETKLQQTEGTLQQTKEECDAAHEELAFSQSECEEARMELEVEKERHKLYQEEYNLLSQPPMQPAGDNDDNSLSAMDGSMNGDDDDNKKQFIDADGFSVNANDDDDDGSNDYVKRLEDELELVTEQLIDTEQRCTDMKLELESLQLKMEGSNNGGQLAAANNAAINASSDAVLELQESLALKEDQLQCLTEELELAKEELSLTQEELRAAEEDGSFVEERVEEFKTQQKKETERLVQDLEAARCDARTSNDALEQLKTTIVKSGNDVESQREEMENLQKALENSRKERAEAHEELESLYEKFDDAKKEAEKEGRSSAIEECQEEISLLEKELKETNEKLLQQQNNEVTAAAGISTTVAAMAAGSSSSAEKEELTKTKEELATLKKDLEQRVSEAEARTTQLEKELSATKGKLYEAEATLIIANKKAKEATTESSSNSKPTATTKATKNNNNNVVDIEKMKSLEKEVNDLKEQNSFYESRCKKLEDQVKQLQKQIGADGIITTDMSRLSSLAGSTMANNNNTNDLKQLQSVSNVEDVIASKDVNQMAEELRQLDKKSCLQRDYNAQLLSKILSLQGNIQVCCRIRPLNDKELNAGQKNVIEPLSEAEMGCFDSRNNKWKSFHFDKVWGPDQSQVQIFSDVEPLALSVVDGYNACIFAYGQTGSGKTYTMEGTMDTYGISYRTIQKLFSLLQVREQQQTTAALVADTNEKFTFHLQLGMLEIYNDEIFDLLTEHASAATKEEQKREAKKAGLKATLDLKRSAEGKMEVPGLTKEPITCLDDVFSLLKRGNANRATAATNLNEHSSRSHMVLCVDVESGLNNGQPSNKGVLYLVDLAGSERVGKSQVEGAQLKEAAAINKSLSALGNVMEALDRKSSHVPYRDSKLTYLLQDAIGGNSRTMMVVAVCPTNHDESVHALQFATRVRRIQRKGGPAQRNVVSKNLEETVKALTQEMKTLSKQKEQSEHSLSKLQKDNTRIQDKLQNLANAKSKSQSDHKTLELLRKNNTDMAARWNKEKGLRERQATDLEKTRTELRKKQTELTKTVRDKETLERQLGEKQTQLEKAQAALKVAKDASSAASVRLKKQQLLLTKQQPNNNHSTSSSRPSVTTKRSTPARKTPLRAATSSLSTTSSVTTAAAAANTTTTTNDAPVVVDVAEIRAQVLALLEKHDSEKVERLDIIMEKFRGKEGLLVDKMRQRYEGAAYRSELALKRHQERMQKISEKKKQQQQQPAN